MKLNKRFLSCLLAGTMVMAPMAAYAGPSTTIEGTGTITDLETEIYNVVLPTSAGIQFSVDPFGLLSAADDTSLSEIVSNAAGSVTSSATAVINKSSVDVNVSITSWLSVSGATVEVASSEAEAKASKDLYLAITELSGASVTSVTTKAAVSATSADVIEKNMYTLSGASITGGTELTSDAVAVTSTTSAGVSAYTKTLKNMADYYKLSGTAVELKEDDIADYAPHAYVFVISGYANPDSDVWEDLAKADSKLALNMKFTIDKADGAGSSSYVTAKTVSSASPSFTVNAPSNVTYTMKATKTDGTVINWTLNDQYKVSGKTVTVQSKPLTNLKGATITISFSDGKTSTLTIQ